MTEEEIAKLVRDAESKKVMKDAIDEWLDKKFSEFGKWSAYGLLAAAVVGALYLMLIANGWHKP